MKICEKCHAENLDSSAFCNHCGNKLPEPEPVEEEPKTSEYLCLYESRKHLYDDSVFARQYIQTSPHLSVRKVNQILNALSEEYYSSAVFNATNFSKNLFSENWHERNSKKPYFEIIGYMKETGLLTDEMAEKMYAINGTRNSLKYDENITEVSPDFAKFAYYEGSAIAEHFCKLIEDIPGQRFKMLVNEPGLARTAQDAKNMLDAGDVRGSIGACGDILRDLLRKAYSAFTQVPFSREIEYKDAIDYFSHYDVISKNALETINIIVKERNKEHSGNTTQSSVFAQRAYDQTSRLTAYLLQRISEAPAEIAKSREKMKPAYEQLWASVVKKAIRLKDYKLCVVEYRYHSRTHHASWNVILRKNNKDNGYQICSQSNNISLILYRFSDYLAECHPHVSVEINNQQESQKNEWKNEWIYIDFWTYTLSTESLLNDPEVNAGYKQFELTRFVNLILKQIQRANETDCFENHHRDASGYQNGSSIRFKPESVPSEPYSCLRETREALYDDSVYARQYLQTSPHLVVNKVNQILNALSEEYYSSAVFNATNFHKNLFSDNWHEPNSKKPYFEIIGYMKETGLLTDEMAEKMYAINGTRNSLKYDEKTTEVSPDFAKYAYYEGSAIAEHLCKLIEDIPGQRFKMLVNEPGLARTAQDAKNMLDAGDVRGSIGACGDILRDLLRKAYAAFTQVPFSREIEYKNAIDYFSVYDVISENAVETINIIVKERNKEHSGNTTQSSVFAQRAYDQTSRLTAYLIQRISEAPAEISKSREKMKPVYDLIWTSIVRTADSLKDSKLLVVYHRAEYDKNPPGASLGYFLCNEQEEYFDVDNFRYRKQPGERFTDLSPSPYRFSDYLVEFHAQTSQNSFTVSQPRTDKNGNKFLLKRIVGTVISTESLLNNPEIIWKLEEKQKEEKRQSEKNEEEKRKQFQNAKHRTLVFLLLILIDLGILALCVFIFSFSYQDYYGLDFLKLHNIISFGDFPPAILLGGSGVVITFLMLRAANCTIGISFIDSYSTGCMIYSGIILVLSLLFAWWHWYAMFFFLYMAIFVQRLLVCGMCISSLISDLRNYKS